MSANSAPAGAKFGIKPLRRLLLPKTISQDCHPVFSGRFTPCFSADFRPVSGFYEAGGILTLPQREKRHTGATAAFTGFTPYGWYGFYKCVFSCKNKFRRHRNGFSHLLSDAFQLHSRGRKMHFRCRLRLYHTSVTEKKCGFCRRRNDFSAFTTLTTHNFYKASSAISFALCLSKHITRRDFPLIRMDTVFCPAEVLMRSSSANAFSSPLGLMVKHSPCSSQSFQTIRSQRTRFSFPRGLRWSG